MPVDTEEDLEAQIAALQARKAALEASKAKEARRKEEEERRVLVGATPTKKSLPEKRRDEPTSPSRRLTTAEALGPRKAVPSASFYGASKPKPARQSLPSIPTGTSRMSTGLATMRRNPSTEAPKPPVRSSSFSHRPSGANAVAGPSRLPSATMSGKGFVNAASLPRGATSTTRGRKGEEEAEEEELEIDDSAPRRDGTTMEIVEKLQYGPGEFGKDTEGEDVWAFLEPNTKIRLAKRTLPHEDLQAFLYGRHLVSPSQLYSVIRLSRDGATYDVPVEGDWVCIAVVAERGDVRVSGSKPVQVGAEDDEDDSSSDEEGEPKPPKSKSAFGKAKAKPHQFEQKQRKPKKYINLKLCALPPRSSSGKSSGAAGDAMLQLLLFESDHIVYPDVPEGEEKKAIYKGGSNGAYEKWCTLAPGDVVGLLNPRVLRPLKAGKSSPHPLTLPLALNPTDQDGIILIGQARDLGCCSAQQRDGSRCRSWVDLRQGPVCEYHISQALNRSRAGRAEFSTAQSSFASTRTGPAGAAGPALSRGALGQKKAAGLRPSSGANAAPRGQDNGGGGATYVVAGRTINTGAKTPGAMNGFGAEHLNEKLGRGRAEKRKRKIEEEEAEKAILERLVKDGGTAGGRYLKAIEAASSSSAPQGGHAKPKRKPGFAGVEAKEGAGEGEERKRTFAAHVIQKLGFDPHKLGMSERDKEERGESIKRLKGSGSRFDEKARVKRVNVRPPPGGDVSAKRDAGGAAKAGPAEDDGPEEGVEEEEMIDLG